LALQGVSSGTDSENLLETVLYHLSYPYTQLSRPTELCVGVF